MNAQWIGIALVTAGDGFESVGQSFLKRATHRVREGDSRGKALRRVFRNWPWVAAGAILCLMNNGLYTLSLMRLSLSLAFPLQAMELVMMAILSRLWLGETVGRRRWTAILLIVAGTVMVTLPGGN